MRPDPQMATVTVPALLDGVETFVQLPFESDFLMLPGIRIYQSTVRPGRANEGNGYSGASYGIRINDSSAPVLPFSWNLDLAGEMVVFVGTVRSFYIQPLNVEAVSATPDFLVGKYCDFGFLGAVYPGNS
jgi:hypothetical protein